MCVVNIFRLEIDRLRYWKREDDIIKVRELSVSPRMNGFEFWERKFFNFLFFYFDNFLEKHRRFLIILIYVVNIFSIEIWRKEDEIIKKSRIFCVTSK